MASKKSLSFMDNLWKKEPSSDGEMFVGLFPPNAIPMLGAAYLHNVSIAKHRFLDKQYEPRKNNRLSTDLRALGNEQFKKNCWRKAMELYNESLRFAEKGSENISLAYANRASCFLHLQKYEECLKDIELARDANYPKRLVHKLEEREVTCIDRLKESPEMQKPIGPKLSFEPDANFPCMANVLEIRHSTEFGRHIVTNRDIEAGQTILVENSFAACFDCEDRTLCFTCMKQAMNFIPCADCTDALFCDENCMQSNDNHKIGCGAAYNRLPGINLVVDTILTAINTFPSVEDLMEFIERTVTASKSGLPQHCHDAQSRYELFLKLDARPTDTDADQLGKQYLTYKCIMDIPALQGQFNSIKKQRFLLHLIWYHKLISMNFFAGTFKGIGQIQCLANITSLFNHSCDPNLFHRTHANQTLCTTMSSVKKGQQLFVNYKKEFFVQFSQTAERQEYLNKTFGFTCKCSRCVPNSRKVDSVRLQMDPNFQFVDNFRHRKIHNQIVDEKLEIQKLMKKCVKFLQKYGHLPASDEIMFVKLAFSTYSDQDIPHILESFEEL